MSVINSIGSRTLTISPNHPFPQPTKSQNYPYPIALIQSNRSRTLKTTSSCFKDKEEEEEESFTDEMLALELSLEINKLSTNMVQREEALNKGKELLFVELSYHMGLKRDDLKRNWKRMSEDEKWVLVNGFVKEWSVDYHPLSARSVKAMVDEYLVGQSSDFENNRAGGFFSDLGKLLGFYKKQ